MINLHTVTIEGPDLAGKTTLYNGLHRASSFKWNIQDRAELSMLCYAELYGRSTDEWHKRLRDSLNNLNKRTIVLLPSKKILLERLKKRGDEFQDKESILNLYKIFKKWSKHYSKYSTIKIIERELSESALVADCQIWLTTRESSSFSQVTKEVTTNARASDNLEAYPLTMEIDLNKVRNTDIDPEILYHPDEEVYYNTILHSVLENIDDELNGRNEYNKKQLSNKTRRFIYTDNSCISLFHTVHRDDRLNFYATCRSSNVSDIFLYDLQFLAYLSKTVQSFLSLGRQKETTLKIILHSAHIV
jgi:hypothetical protein